MGKSIVLISNEKKSKCKEIVEELKLHKASSFSPCLFFPFQTPLGGPSTGAAAKEMAWSMIERPPPFAYPGADDARPPPAPARGCSGKG